MGRYLGPAWYMALTDQQRAAVDTWFEQRGIERTSVQSVHLHDEGGCTVTMYVRDERGHVVPGIGSSARTTARRLEDQPPCPV